MLPAFNGNMLFLARQIRRMGQEDLVLAMVESSLLPRMCRYWRAL
jgi:hypothetical protein